MKSYLADMAFILICIAVVIFTAWFLKGIISNLIKDIKQLVLCKHEYYKVGFREVENEDTRYSERLYKCDKCGHEEWVDGRYDYINKPPKEHLMF